MTISKIYTVEGVAYLSIAKLAAAYDLPAKRVQKRIRIGWAPKQAVDLEPSAVESRAEHLVVEGGTFKSHAEAARYYGLEPKLVNERVTKFGWSLAQAVGAEPRPSKPYSKVAFIDGTEYSSMREAAKELGVAQSTLINRIKSGIAVEDALSASHAERKKLKGQSKLMFYGGKLYPSARHLLAANPVLVAGGDINKLISALNDKARRAKNKGEIKNLSIDQVAAEFSLPKVRFLDEFDGLVVQLAEKISDNVLSELFYDFR